MDLYLVSLVVLWVWWMVHGVAYSPRSVSCIITASRLARRIDDDVVFFHPEPNTMELLMRMLDITLITDNVEDKLGVYATRIVRAKKKWYDPFIVRHLIEPRVRSLKPRINEYGYLLNTEYYTIAKMQGILYNYIAGRQDGYLAFDLGTIFIATKKRIPTGDMAIAIYSMLHKKRPVCVASWRDVGLTISCYGGHRTVLNIYSYLKSKKYASARIIGGMNGNLISGFILTFPESPAVAVDEIARLLERTPAKPAPPEAFAETLSKHPFIDSVIEKHDYYNYLKLRMRVKAPKKYISGYYLLQASNNASHTVETGDNYTVYTIYLPVPDKIVLESPKKPREVIVGSTTVEPNRITETDKKYLVFLSEGRKIRRLIRLHGKTAVALLY